MSHPSPSARRDIGAQRINLVWIIRLRWWGMAAQGLTVSALASSLTMATIGGAAALIALGVLSNIWLRTAWRSDRLLDERHLLWVMVGDVILLTGLLGLTGGPSNPFSALYLAQIAMAAAVLRGRAVGWLAASAVGGFALLFALPADPHAHHHGPEQMEEHVRGMWLAFGITAAYISYFVSRVLADLDARERELGIAEQRMVRAERLGSLVTLTAGAAHELSTPLSTIAVVAKELERGLTQPAHGADARLIRREVARCQEILARMRRAAGEPGGEAHVAVSVSKLIETATAGILPERLRFDPGQAFGARLRVPVGALSQAMRCVVDNALQASSGATPVAIRARQHLEGVEIEVTDDGAGMTPDVLGRAGEPFFTTKPPGQGTGLGLFLARAVVEQVGGRLSLENISPRGLRVRMVLPMPGMSTS